MGNYYFWKYCDKVWMLRIMKVFNSPAGKLVICASDGKLTMCDWVESPQHARHLRRLPACVPDDEYEELVCRALQDYFDGKTTDFDHIVVNPLGTPFQKSVWEALRGIPFGATVSYAEIARRVGSHPRAVAAAIGSNPVSIIIPCHRVVGSDGSLTGYAGGMEAKALLLKLEECSV